jgi:hypothetical protein
MSAVIHVIDNIPIAVDEITGVLDTQNMCNVIKQKYPNHRIVIYPDSSGKNRTTNADKTDINILKNENIIKEKTIKRITNKKLKTYKYWSIIEESNLMHLICETNFSSVPYKLINNLGVLYEKGCHFSKIILLCRKN